MTSLAAGQVVRGREGQVGTGPAPNRIPAPPVPLFLDCPRKTVRKGVSVGATGPGPSQACGCG